MNFKDQWATDENGNKFVFTVEMQRQLSQAGLPVDPDYLDQIEGNNGAKSNTPSRKRTSVPSPESRDSSEFSEPTSIQIDPITGKYLGRLKWYNSTRGYGFIARGGGEDIFFHKTDTIANPDEFVDGQWVLYDVESTQKGLEASEVENYEGEPPLEE